MRIQSVKETNFKQWVNSHSDMLYSYTIKHGFDIDLAKDIIQETFLAAWRNMDGYKAEASVKNWLFIILKSKITDYFRKTANKVMLQAVHREHNQLDYFDAGDHWDINAYPKEWKVNFDDRTEVKDFYTVFKSCGKKLKEIQNSVFVMKYVDGLESEEICKVLGISSSNYWVLIHRAKVQLRACLEKNWMDK